MSTTRKSPRNRAALAGVAGAVLLSSLAAAPAAQAAARDGKCEAGEFCLYFNSDQKGSVSDFKGDVPDYGARQPTCFEFRGPGKGKGRCVKNAAASVWNRTSGSVTVYFNSNYGGTAAVYGFGSKGNLGALKNQNASHRAGSTNAGGGGSTGGGGGGSTAGKAVAMSYALYRAGGGRITAGFDGYERTSGKHEGIDIARGAGSPIRALTPGTVVNVQEAAGSSGLSTIAVYNASYGKTVLYLHSNPDSGLQGKAVKRGQRIGVEDDRGVAGRTHTHVEVRDGRQTNASFSSNGTLENRNPASFWKARGYAIR